MEENGQLPCAKKLSFDSRAEAEGAAAAADWHYGSKLKVYKCRHCQLWHLATD